MAKNSNNKNTPTLIEEKEKNRKKEEEKIDEAIEESFPASDPPAWTAGIRYKN